jgi:hypothetical protein
LRQAAHCRVVELDRGIGFQEFGNTPSKHRDRTLHCRKLGGRFCVCGPVKIQEHLVRRESACAAGIGLTPAGPHA